jgi:2-octaprenyl-6-methoxyphenol hydroxylase
VTPSLPLSQTPRRFTALVRGAGPTGALAALALAKAGWNVTLVDPSERSQLLERTRAYALTHSSRRLLRHLHLWDPVEAVLEPFERLELEDLGARRHCGFHPGDLWGTAAAPSPVGWIGQHGPLMGVLLAQLEAHPAIDLRLGDPPVASPVQVEAVEADWIIAAEGAHSPTREALGIGVWRHLYQQRCLTAQVRLRGAPSHTAWERLRPEGPFALLPMGDGRFQVVWSAPAWRCHQLERLSPAAFLDALAPVLPPGVDVDHLEDDPRVFPVGLLLARRLHRGRALLVGESAHRCHPVGGQGLNLCWRDVELLHRLAQRVEAGRLPIHQLGGRYARGRWADLCLTLLITDGLVRLFSNRQPLLVPMRKLAISQLDRMPFLRRCLLGVMTNGPCQPFAAAPT